MFYKTIIYFVTLNLLGNYNAVNSAKILAIFPGPILSHYDFARAIFGELGKQGHEVTVISSFALGKELNNVNDIQVNGAKQLFQGKCIKLLIFILFN